MAESVYVDPTTGVTNSGEGPGTYQPGVYQGGAAVAGDDGSGGGGGGGGGDPWRPGAGAAFPGAFNYNLPSLARFNAPKFAAPSYAQAAEDPGYRFARDAGQDALQKSAAARGVLRTGGTLKDLATWNQNFAAQHYNTVFNRALQAFDRNYAGAKDEYAPTMAEWRAGVDMEKTKALSEYNGQLAAWQLGQYNQKQFDAGFNNPPA